MNNFSAIINISATLSTLQPTSTTNVFASRNVQAYLSNATNNSVNVEEKKGESVNRLLFALVLQSVIVLIFLGNALVLAALTCYRKWTTPDVFLFSLSSADLLDCVVAIEIITVVKYFLGRPMGKLKCDVFVALIYIFRTASATTVTGIALERAILFIYPLWHHTSVTVPRTKKVVAGIWSFSIVCGLLPFIGVGHSGFHNGVCYSQIYNLGMEYAILIEVYGAVMLLAVFASYFAVKLSGKLFIQRQTFMAGCGEIRQRSQCVQKSGSIPRSASGTQNVRKTTVMMEIVVITYYISWLPFLLNNLYCLIVKKQPSTKIVLFTSMISLLHAFANPLLYGWMCQRYRRGYYFVLKKAWRICGGHRLPRRSLCKSRRLYTMTKVTRQLSAADITIQGSRLPLPLTELVPAAIEKK
ncbi:adenosine receptor A2b-like [Montipora foliosa]|uniref:adenosine receptor A2b-like n=1 Tax=Montipora foliosa TaxID=591990 RepID=UPI0035F12CE7